MKLHILTWMFGSQINNLIKENMSQHLTRNNTNRRSRRSESRVGDSYASNGKRFRKGKGGEFDDLSTLSSKERKKKAANR